MKSILYGWSRKVYLLSFLVFLWNSVDGFPKSKEEETSAPNKSKVNSVQSFIDNMKTQGEDTLMTELPKRIGDLCDLLDQPEWNEENMDNLHEDSNIPIPDPTANKGTQLGIHSGGSAKVYTFSTGMAPSNKKMLEFVEKTRVVVNQMFKDINILRLWITFMIPKIEDGGNFGFLVQKEIVNDIETVEKQTMVLYLKVSQYHDKRANIISKIAKFPHIEDYRKALDEYDEEQYFFLWVNLAEIRTNYAMLYDSLMKNKEKLMKPRSSTGDSMFQT